MTKDFKNAANIVFNIGIGGLLTSFIALVGIPVYVLHNNCDMFEIIANNSWNITYNDLGLYVGIFGIAVCGPIIAAAAHCSAEQCGESHKEDTFQIPNDQHDDLNKNRNPYAPPRHV